MTKEEIDDRATALAIALLVTRYNEQSDSAIKFAAKLIGQNISAAIAAEREACAKVALAYELPETSPQDQHGRVMASLQIAAAIRARG